ncbi:kinase-like domain-containing protein [Cladorrhinum samala]|uniref:Kinase-like domain-containing protein n=1 Tax=Cladorrhinum samala TaxID=585594 RepID=A0AAV9HBN7_9PEZI|nr:kinase-like domain-containing protein [Cladorrhinum samala]
MELNPSRDFLILLTQLTRLLIIRKISELSNGETRALLGEGATSTVHKVTNLRVKDLWNPGPCIGGETLDVPVVALKTAKHQSVNKAADGTVVTAAMLRRLKTVLFEVQVLSRPDIARHPNIISLLAYSYWHSLSGYDERSWSFIPDIALEFSPWGNARNFFAQGPGPPRSDAYKLALCRDVAAGLAFLHAYGITHGDVKLENVLIFPGPLSIPVAKIADIELSPQNPAFGPCAGYMGTEAYLAPEVAGARINGSHLPVEELWYCDVFAFGLLVLEVFASVDFYWNAGPSGTKVANCFADDDTALSLALNILQNSLESVSGSGLFATGQQLLEATLQKSPLDRLPSGWPGVHEQSTVIISSYSVDEPLSYDILQVLSHVDLVCEYRWGGTVWAELERLATTAPTPQERGQARFGLFICATATQYAPCHITCIEDALNLLASAANDGYAPACVIGKRVFEANHRPAPSILAAPLPEHASDEMRRELATLENADSSEYYSIAVRVLWPLHLRDQIRRSLGVQADSHAFTAELINKAVREMGRGFKKYADAHSLLHHGIISSNIAACRRLLKLGVNVNLQILDGITPLSLACRFAEYEIVRLLLAYNANPCILDEAGSSPLHWLITTRDEDSAEVLKLMLKNISRLGGSSPGDPGLAVSYACYDQLAFQPQGTALEWAILSRHSTLIGALLGSGLIRLAGREELMHYFSMAAATTCPETVRAVARHFKDAKFTIKDVPRLLSMVGKNAWGSTELYRWIAHGPLHQDGYRATIDSILDLCGIPTDIDFSVFDRPEAQGRGSPMVIATITFRIEVITELARRGSGLNVVHGPTDNQECGYSLFRTPLEIQAFLDAGADLSLEAGSSRIDSWMDKGRTAVAESIPHCRWDNIEYLLDHGSPLEFGTLAGEMQTLLHLVVFDVFLISWKLRPYVRRGSPHIEDHLIVLRNLVLYCHQKRDVYILLALNHTRWMSPAHLAMSLGLPLVLKTLIALHSETQTPGPYRSVFEFGSVQYYKAMQDRGGRDEFTFSVYGSPCSVNFEEYCGKLKEVKEICDEVLYPGEPPAIREA